MAIETTIDPAVLRQFTGQTEIQDTAVAEQRYVAAAAARVAAEKRLSRIGWVVWYFHLRLWAARRGVPDWAAGLLAGTLAAIGAALLFIFVLGAGVGWILVGILFAYAAFGGAAFWVFRLSKEETEITAPQVRAEQLRIAEEKRQAAEKVVAEKAAAADAAHRLWRALLEAWESETNKQLQALQREADQRKLEESQLLNIDPGRLYPDEFEKYVADIFQHLGFTVEMTGKSGDQGVDVVASKGVLRIAIQAKQHTGTVGNSSVQQAFAGMAHYKCDRCMVITSSDFTSSARELAESTGCLLIGKGKLPGLIRGEIGF